MRRNAGRSRAQRRGGDADLSGELVKQRGAQAGRRPRGRFRTVIACRVGDRAVFLFAKRSGEPEPRNGARCERLRARLLDAPEIGKVLWLGTNSGRWQPNVSTKAKLRGPRTKAYAVSSARSRRQDDDARIRGALLHGGLSAEGIRALRGRAWSWRLPRPEGCRATEAARFLLAFVWPRLPRAKNLVSELGPGAKRLRRLQAAVPEKGAWPRRRRFNIP
jgi:hypothetical protein